MEELSDEELVMMLLEGKEDSLGLLYAKHSRWATTVAQGVVKDGALAEDIVAKVFYRACEKISSLKNRRGLKSWLFRSVFREALLQGKRRARMVLIEPEQLGRGKGAEVSALVAPPRVTRRDRPDRLLDRKELRLGLMDGLAALPDLQRPVAYRELVRWALGEQYVPTQQELADLMGVSRDAYQRLRMKAKNDLREMEPCAPLEVPASLRERETELMEKRRAARPSSTVRLVGALRDFFIAVPAEKAVWLFSRFRKGLEDVALGVFESLPGFLPGLDGRRR